jgi:ABC-2 type transport system ATP-binding protein
MTGVDTAAIRTDGLTKKYGETVAVDAVDLEIEPGEIFGLLGPNGAGKTTTILMLLGLTEPTSGTARVAGRDPARDSLAVKALVGYLPDDVGFYDNLTGRQNLRYTARLNGLAPDVTERRIERLLADVDLVESADRRVGGYSRGMRQRLGIADALVKDPSILILDEPTVNIDPEGVRHVLDLVEVLRDRHGVTVLLSSHLLGQVQRVCDRVGIFVAGRLAATGTIAELAGMRPYEIEIGVTDPGADLARIVGGIDGVSSVSRLGEMWVVSADGDRRTQIVDAVHDAGLSLVHVSLRRADLDSVYQTYFGGGDDDGR